MYPMLKEGVELGTFTIEGSTGIYHYACNPDGEEFEISARIAHELARADGTRTLRLPKKTIDELKSCSLIQTSRFVKGEGYNRLILVPIGSKAKKYRNLCFLLNSIFPILAVGLFVTSIFLKPDGNYYIGRDFSLLIYCTLAVVSLLIHESGHLIAGLSYGYKINDLGILLLGVFPIGAYVAHEPKTNVRKCEQIQFSLAGIELNLLLAGVFTLLSMEYSCVSMTLISIANLNVALAILNLLPAAGLDGENALSQVLGVDSINTLAKKCLFKKSRRKQLLKAGIKGYACMGIFCFSVLADVTVWLLIGLDIVCAVVNMFW